MNYAQIIREKAVLWYGRASQIVFGLNLLAWLASCVVAGGPVGPIHYIAWLDHCCQWPGH